MYNVTLRFVILTENFVIVTQGETLGESRHNQTGVKSEKVEVQKL